MRKREDILEEDYRSPDIPWTPYLEVALDIRDILNQMAYTLTLIQANTGITASLWEAHEKSKEIKPLSHTTKKGKKP